ncbi:thioesterase family protein [Chryseolinea sp. H1M3-3]|uniref:acyl-CoA thioesterase n=1 Tax=Chryseolinea sp. H1M3-3 TaxID=3034144 RepID=UPI0023EACC13|nr:thioesterase family protein [Chryseolinea sp. H1M3-3]
MARIQLNLPEKFLFSTELTVRASDLNYGNHVGHDTILTIMQEARIKFYQTLGFKNELNFEGSIGQVIADAAVQYKSESFLGDELTIKVGVSDFNKYGFDMHYLIDNKATGKEVARGKTGIVCFDYDTRKVARIPEKLREKLQ